MKKIELGKFQSVRKQIFYDKIMRNTKMSESLVNQFFQKNKIIQQKKFY
jgi:hypothetical protein